MPYISLHESILYQLVASIILVQIRTGRWNSISKEQRWLAELDKTQSPLVKTGVMYDEDYLKANDMAKCICVSVVISALRG